MGLKELLCFCKEPAPFGGLVVFLYFFDHAFGAFFVTGDGGNDLGEAVGEFDIYSPFGVRQ